MIRFFPFLVFASFLFNSCGTLLWDDYGAIKGDVRFGYIGSTNSVCIKTYTINYDATQSSTFTNKSKIVVGAILKSDLDKIFNSLPASEKTSTDINFSYNSQDRIKYDAFLSYDRLDAPGGYIISFVPNDENVTVIAFYDSNSDGILNTGEPFGLYDGFDAGNSIGLSSGDIRYIFFYVNSSVKENVDLVIDACNS